jgi:hypothetical protein
MLRCMQHEEERAGCISKLLRQQPLLLAFANDYCDTDRAQARPWQAVIVATDGNMDSALARS